MRMLWLGLGLAAACLSPAIAQDYSGAWTFYANGYKGELYLKQEGSRIRGWIGVNGVNLDRDTLAGTTKGNEIVFSRSNPQLTQPQEYRGYLLIHDNPQIEARRRMTGSDALAGIFSHLGTWGYGWYAIRAGAFREDPGAANTTSTAAPSTAAGKWRQIASGDCPGRDVGGSTGPNPDPARCTAAFQGFTAVCWQGNCTYKNIPAASCTGGASPGRMYVCDGAGATAVPVAAGGWTATGTGDCPGRDVGGSTGPNPDPAKCTAAFQGFTAVCWQGNCTYKNIPVASCTGGASPGRMYVCNGAGVAPVPASGGGWTATGTGDCPGRDVGGSTGPNPDPAKCTAAFQGFTAVCWQGNCTYKNIPTASCTGGASPGRMFICNYQARH